MTHKHVCAFLLFLACKSCFARLSTQEIVPEAPPLEFSDDSSSLIAKLRAEISKLQHDLERCQRSRLGPRTELVSSSFQTAQPAVKVFGMAQFWIPKLSGATAHLSSSHEKDSKTTISRALLGTGAGPKKKVEDKLKWTASFPKGSPISKFTSRCYRWWTKKGPGKLGQKKTADKYKDEVIKVTQKADTPSFWHKSHDGTKTRKWRPYTWIVKEKDHWAVGVRFGCDSSFNGFAATYHSFNRHVARCTKKDARCDRTQVCGCHEIWCPVNKDMVLSSPKDTHRKCYTVTQPFGCFYRDKWSPSCSGGMRYFKKGSSIASIMTGPYWQLMNF